MGLVVSVLTSESNSLHSSSGRGHCIVSLGKTLYSLTVPLSTRVYKRVVWNLMLGVSLQQTSIPSGGGGGEKKYSLVI